MIGLSPNEVARTSIWRFRAAIAGYAQANGSDRGDAVGAPPTADEHDAILRRFGYH